MEPKPRRGPGRPPNPDGPHPTPSTSIRIPRELRQQVDQVRTKRGESIADAVLWGLRRYIARHG